MSEDSDKKPWTAPVLKVGRVCEPQEPPPDDDDEEEEDE
jgi:hypothetical protein